MAFTWSPRRPASAPSSQPGTQAPGAFRAPDTSDGSGAPGAPGAPSARVPVLVVTGPAGVGKTAVAQAVTRQARHRGLGCALIDLDELRNLSPAPDDDPRNERLALANLGAVWPNFRRAGAQCLCLATVVESRAAAERIAAAVPGADLRVVRLDAPLIAIRERLAGREQGTTLTLHLQRTAQHIDLFARSRPEDLVIGTEGRTVQDVAAEITDGWTALHALA